ncbi:MAG: DNA polymerase III subunit delta' [Alphaproteobacteria bacterium]|jgi:DNA polymerase-3 subunit delta'|nr:DNA polymerase III subunit delta' [Alphaproteobacteria bacterium]
MPETLSPHQCTQLVGHRQAFDEVVKAFSSGKMHHAWLIVGEEGIGKATFAYMAAHYILSGGENNPMQFNTEHPTARLILAESHPDLLVIRRPVDEKTGAMKASIPVEEARKLAPFLSLTPANGKYRVALIDEAHTLGRNAQNAILKMIEEPPSNAFIFLTTTTTGMMLPTIKSRCRVLALNSLTQSEIMTILSRQMIEIPDGIDKTRLAELAGGSVGKALRIIESEIVPLYDEAIAMLCALPQIDVIRLHELGDKIAKKAEIDRYSILSELIVETIQRTISSLARGQGGRHPLAKVLVNKGGLEQALALWDTARERLASAEASNLDKKLTFINAVSDMSRMCM